MEEQHSNQIWVMHKKSMEESIIGERIEKHLRNLCNGSKGYAIEALIANHVRPINIHTGFMLCEFVVHHGVSDENGNWHVGAMATLIDVIGSLTVFSFTASDNVTVDFALSYFSNAKLQEEVEIEGKVVGKKERMTSVSVEVRKKHNREVVALAKLWMAPANAQARTLRLTSKL